MSRLPRSWFLALSCAAVMCAGCSDDEVTSLVVTVESDMPRDALDEARVRIEGSSGAAEVAKADLTDKPLPRVVTVLPGDADLLTPVQLRASGWLDGNEVLSQSREAYFVEGRAVPITMTLNADCVDVTCPAGESCVNGKCRGEAVDAGVDAGADADIDAGTDAGEAGTGEYCIINGNPRDCSSMDGVCLIGECDEDADECVATTAPDGHACSTGGMCSDGVCERNIDCGGATCSPTCDTGVCTVDCTGATNCTPTCSADATCDIDCTDGNCPRVRCRDNASCLLDCSGSSTCGFQMCTSGMQSCPGDIKVCGRDCP